MGDPVQSLSKTVHPEVAGPKLQQNRFDPLEKSVYRAFEGSFSFIRAFPRGLT